MAVVVVTETDGADQEFYETVSGQVMPGGELPEGMQVHIAGPIEGGWRVITVWDSEDQFNQFREEKLIPALQAAGAGDRIAPKIQANEAYRVIA
jgi:hypothetical protein